MSRCFSLVVRILNDNNNGCSLDKKISRIFFLILCLAFSKWKDSCIQFFFKFSYFFPFLYIQFSYKSWIFFPRQTPKHNDDAIKKESDLLLGCEHEEEILTTCSWFSHYGGKYKQWFFRFCSVVTRNGTTWKKKISEDFFSIFFSVFIFGENKIKFFLW